MYRVHVCDTAAMSELLVQLMLKRDGNIAARYAELGKLSFLLENTLSELQSTVELRKDEVSSVSRARCNSTGG